MTSPNETALVEDLAARATAASRRRDEGAIVSGVRPLTGGSSSLTFVADVVSPSSTERVVLKVAPPGLEPIRNRDVLRQGRVMDALAGASGVRVPAVLFDDAGAPTAIPPFVAMSLMAGECVEPLLEESRDHATHERTYARFLDAARMLGHLHSARPADLGLADEPVVTLPEEIARWTRAFETAPEDLRGDYLTCAEALHDTMPEQLAPVVNHGDYRLGNTLCEGDRVTAIIDWEIWSVGDPRIDLTWLTYFTDEAGHPAAPSSDPCGTPTIDEVVRAYEVAVGHSVPDITWFDALTRYKEAAATALLIKRARKRNAMPPAFVRMEPALPGLVKEALALLGR
ncbi:phosphotransferase family protein [Rhodococcus opacus]|uniref:phosphotransferase family protein n=1 Tax=Rhodococcus opacus TaxID=37919 RepID=UPI001C4482E9|nr:phosphotransferase family protein [Rhodococcus opacus]MBV6756176.1 phosphotransferase family protein [Rhodococcus opacus]